MRLWPMVGYYTSTKINKSYYPHSIRIEMLCIGFPKGFFFPGLGPFYSTKTR